MKFLYIILSCAMLGACAHKPIKNKHIAPSTSVVSTKIGNAKESVVKVKKSTDDSKKAIETAKVHTESIKAKLDKPSAALIDEDLKALQTQLNIALANAANARIELDNTTLQLEFSTEALKLLKDQVETQTVVLNETIDKYNSQLQETEKWKQKHAEALEKLWFWRKIAMAIGGLIAAYGVFLVLKLVGKAPI